MGAKQQGADAASGRWLVSARTLCFILNGDDVLLMKRTSNTRIFPNKYNGVGGHIERDEDAYTSAKREILEETGLAVQDLRLRAIHNIDAGADSGIMMLVFTAVSDQREITVETHEGTLHWIPVTEVANYDVVEDLTIILPRVLAMQPHDPPLFVHVSYDDTDQIVMQWAEQG
ncbi:MAG TPA: NUDIX domain-containing protein [Phototrophicaceae bacterium]|nr:NUDIX domain-containing protein [Phototrophicaceae bacterium]